MHLGHQGHLTFCSNIFPGETWLEVHEQLISHLPAIKQRVCPEQPFGLGLRLSAVAARQLLADNRLEDFQQWMEHNGLYLFTLNGFAYGSFHGYPVKASAYRPDWRDPRRLAYTQDLAQVLAKLLPPGMTGTISTLPGGNKHDINSQDAQDAVISNLMTMVAYLHRLEQSCGRHITLALEPEPDCLLETTDNVLDFYQSGLLSTTALDALCLDVGIGREQAQDLVRRHIGICLDTCHASVMYESPLSVALALLTAGIPLVKLQLTSALKVPAMDAVARRAMKGLMDPICLHQTVVHQGNQSHYYSDLPDALKTRFEAHEGSEWRTHFHVPVYCRDLGAFSTTSDELAELLAYQRRRPICQHLEVETYTFDLLPTALWGQTVGQNVVEELNWVRHRLRN